MTPNKQEKLSSSALNTVLGNSATFSFSSGAFYIGTSEPETLP